MIVAKGVICQIKNVDLHIITNNFVCALKQAHSFDVLMLLRTNKRIRLSFLCDSLDFTT